MIATVVALVGAFNAPVPSHSVSRVSDVTMGARKGASTIGKRGVSTKTGSQGFVDVTGAKSQEVARMASSLWGVDGAPHLLHLPCNFNFTFMCVCMYACGVYPCMLCVLCV